MDGVPYEGICSVGGDGLAHEIVNGLLNRKDKLTHLPYIGFLQGGSSDAMLKAILHECNEDLSFENAIFMIGKGQ